MNRVAFQARSARSWTAKTASLASVFSRSSSGVAKIDRAGGFPYLSSGHAFVNHARATGIAARRRGRDAGGRNRRRDARRVPPRRRRAHLAGGPRPRGPRPRAHPCPGRCRQRCAKCRRCRAHIANSSAPWATTPPAATVREMLVRAGRRAIGRWSPSPAPRPPRPASWPGPSRSSGWTRRTTAT